MIEVAKAILRDMIGEAEDTLARAREENFGGRRTVTAEQTGGVQRVLGGVEALRAALKRIQDATEPYERPPIP